jgi:hypothetical protein
MKRLSVCGLGMIGVKVARFVFGAKLPEIEERL